ncbi:MAG: prepilin-type N-terminal cleavage/methylation domain-containing protein [Bdellovibrionales bacterium]|nr:prepilin-type N-terminal cleavage/methylation domain-containing protein [Bdellovibrionales bacterium]
MKYTQTKGFSLLEVMFAMVILSMSLIALMKNETQTITLAQKAKDWDIATTLATAKMSELTTLAEKKGFVALKDEEQGEFDQEMFPTYRWRYWKQPVPQPNFEALMNVGSETSEGSEVPESSEAMAGPLQMIGKAWSEALLELHVEILWGEGESLRSFDLATHLLANDTNNKIMGIVGALGAKP